VSNIRVDCRDMPTAEWSEPVRKHAEERVRADARACAGARREAVIGVRYDGAGIMNGVTEVPCYGTAVVVERAEDAG
jgi:uncharacterized protein YbjQ (UPF0145 family)